MDARQSILEQARSRVTQISPLDAKARLDRGDVDLFLDVREAHEWRKGHIPGALRVALDEVPDKADPAASSAQEDLTGRVDGNIIVYCATGVRSVIGAYLLQNLGYRHVTSLAGGIQGWQEAGNPVER